MDYPARFLECYALGDILEGGAGDDPNDRGGLTARGGWTQEDYDGYRARKGLPSQPVTLATDEERQDCYWSEYWLPSGCHLLAAPLDFILYQRVLNMNAAYSVADLQEIVGCKVDFCVGPFTAKACEAYGWALAAQNLLTAQAQAYKSIVIHSNTGLKEWANEGRRGKQPADQRSFGPGWINRCTHAAALVKLAWAPDQAIVAFMNAQHANFKAGIVPA